MSHGQQAVTLRFTESLSRNNTHIHLVHVHIRISTMYVYIYICTYIIIILSLKKHFNYVFFYRQRHIRSIFLLIRM